MQFAVSHNRTAAIFRMDLVLAFLENVVTPAERNLASIIDQAGGLEAARGNPHVLEALLAVQRQYESPAVPGPDIIGLEHWRTSRSADSYRQRRRVMIYSPQVTRLQGMAGSLPGTLQRYILLMLGFSQVYSRLPNPTARIARHITRCRHLHEFPESET